MGSYRAKNASISELLKAHARGILPGMLKVDQGNREAILRALNNWGWDDSLELYLPFDETAGQTAFDLSGNGNTGTATGTTIVDGVFGKERSFDGVDDVVSCGNPATLNLVSAISVEAWIKPKETFTDYQGIMGKGGGGAFEYGYEFAVCGGLFGFWINGCSHLASTAKPALDSLNHWVGTYNKGSIKLYRDGKLVDTTVYAADMVTNSCDFMVGRVSIMGGVKNYTQADFDEVRIYSRALSADEIYLHYLAGALKLGLI